MGAAHEACRSIRGTRPLVGGPPGGSRSRGFRACPAGNFALCRKPQAMRRVTSGDRERGPRMRQLEPGAFLELGVVRLPTIARDGARVAYVVQRPDAAGLTYSADVTVVDLTGERSILLAEHRVSGIIGDMAFTASGELLVGLEDRLMVIDAQGASGPRVVWKAPGLITRIVTAPEGDRVLVAVATRREEPRETVTVARSGRYKWDGRGVLASRPDGVYLLASWREAEADVRRLGEADRAYAQPAFSPDGTRMTALEVAASAVGPSEGRVVVWADALSAQALTPELDILTYAWLPDGRGILAAGADAPFGSAQPRSFAVYGLDGSVTPWHPHDEHIGSGLILCDWRWPTSRVPLVVAEDGCSALALTLREGTVGVWRYFDNRPPEPVLFDFGAVSDWAVDGTGRRLCYTFSTPTAPDELVVRDLAGGIRWRSEVNAAWANRLGLRAPEAFTVRAPDGRAIQAWLLRPVGTGQEGSGNGGYPLVLAVHGGPHGAWGHTLYLEHQILAAHGIGVLWVNPRGSTGYGFDFARQVVGHWGEEDMQDLLAAVDEVTEHRGADPKRLAVMGTSYGGFMSAWLIGHDRRFRTAVVQAPVVDQISMYGTSDIGRSFLAYQLALAPGGTGPNLERLWEKSPLRYVPQVTASVLLICGEADERCPIGQSEEYYAALLDVGAEVTFARYPGEPHGLTSIGSPAHRLHRQRTVVAWLTNHLGTARARAAAGTAAGRGA